MVMILFLSVCWAVELIRCHPTGLQEEAYCGTYQVLENHLNPTGKTIDLHILVLPSVRANPSVDPVFVFAGGPGQGASEVAVSMMPMLRRIHQQRTIVFLDQRGTGESGSLDCELDEFLSSSISKDALIECQKKLAVDTTQYTSDILARDTDEVREALGYHTINIYGGSYGTRLGLVYIRNYPQHVRSAVLDGVAPPQIPIGGDFGEYAQRALQSVIADCTADTECANAFPLLEKRFYMILANLEQPKVVHLPHPTTFEIEQFTIDKNLFLGTLQQLLYDPTTSSLIPFTITAAYDENWSPLIALGNRDSFGQISIGLYLSIVCAEDVPRIDFSSPTKHIMGTHLTEELQEMCSVWPVDTIDQEFYLPVESSVPILLLSGQHDPVTPPENALIAKETLPNSIHIEVPGMAHNTLRSECMLQIFQDFVVTLDETQLDLSCVSKHSRPPFVLSPSGTAP
jgi:pimeloyl-ACP methyl ester carboxylesterase